MKLTIDNLEKAFYEASIQEKKFIGIKVEMLGFENPEIIINDNANFDKKFEYYRGAYNDNLTLKNAPDKVKIVGFTYGDSFEEIESDLIGNI